MWIFTEPLPSMRKSVPISLDDTCILLIISTYFCFCSQVLLLDWQEIFWQTAYSVADGDWVGVVAGVAGGVVDTAEDGVVDGMNVMIMDRSSLRRRIFTILRLMIMTMETISDMRMTLMAVRLAGNMKTKRVSYAFVLLFSLTICFCFTRGSI